ncbi:phospholipase [Helicobacter sp. MIT 00-7814]|uniref:phospholipase D family protein n=1 Tax=unclassified Helicobacter TaxID=2593540 RepID=UPI000E1F44EF|nr:MULTISPECIES: phospholipase D family protein [unclassified Helicobacter]RDU54613.1 phospholipase [Helicobacter sp. MIT 00-7814]RDU54672.1 phospholipase [Helicobacter sp. MIT 99-10781]
MTFISQYLFSTTNIFVVFVLCLFVYAGCSSVVVNIKDVDKSKITKSISIEPFNPQETLIGQVYAKELEENKNKSGAMLITDGTQALLHRTALTRIAQKSIYLQSYIYKDEISSKVFMYELWKAANRGVKVRMLIDDNGLDSDFSDIITLDSHPNIEVKIFNPYKNRSKVLRYPEMIYDFNRINHRMHNKIFVVDELALIIGGRNVADNYFDNNAKTNFADTDAIFLGQVAKEASENFLLYWQYERSIPAYLLPSKRTMKNYQKDISKAVTKLKTYSDEHAKYEELLSEFLTRYKNKEFALAWGNAKFLADSPLKVENPNIERPISNALREIFLHTTDEIYVAAAYFVPGKHMTKGLEELKNRGIRLNVLTNSLASTDSLVVYGAWERYRDHLARAGVAVYEYQYEGKKKNAGLRSKLNSSAGASLHSKSIVFDERITWIGSFNLDERSRSLNTESVVVFDNAEFAQKTKRDIQEQMADSWRVWSIDGKTYWKGYNKDGVFEIHTSEPNANFLLKAASFISKILPEDQI